MKNYRAQTPQNLALSKIFQNNQENKHIPSAKYYLVKSKPGPFCTQTQRTFDFRVNYKCWGCLVDYTGSRMQGVTRKHSSRMPTARFSSSVGVLPNPPGCRPLFPFMQNPLGRPPRCRSPQANPPMQTTPVGRCPPPWTDKHGNITLPQTSFAGCKKTQMKVLVVDEFLL